MISLILPLLIMPIILTIVFNAESSEDDNLNYPRLAIFLVDEEEKINITDKSTEYTAEYEFITQDLLEPLNPTIIEVNDFSNMYFKDSVDLALLIGKGFISTSNSSTININILYNPSYNAGAKYASHMVEVLSVYSSDKIVKNLEEYNINLDVITPTTVGVQTFQNYTTNKVEGLNNATLISLMPIVIIGFISFGSAAASSELYSLEKERNTLESLLSTSANRKNIIKAKIFVGITFSIIGSVGNFLAVFMSFILNKEHFGDASIYFRPLSLLVIFLTLITLSIFTSLLSAYIYVFSKNNRNAASLNTVLMMFPMMLSYLVIGIRPSGVMMWQIFIPFFGTVLATKMAVVGVVIYAYLLLSILINVLLTFILTRYTIKRFCTEKVLDYD